MTAWPGTLPDWSYHSINVTFGEGRQVTATDAGFVQSKVIASNPPHILQLMSLYDGSEVDSLMTFYFTTLQGGTQSFTHVNPFTGSGATFYFRRNSGPPQVRHVISGKRDGPRSDWLWEVQFELEWHW